MVRDWAKVFRDPVHGDIFLSDMELSIVDSPEFQRLRRIKQLGMTYLVYASANHTRFEHSMGAMHLAGRIVEKLGLGEEESMMLRAAALLHDLGHGPLSHTSAEILERLTNQSHERITMDITKASAISDVLRLHGLKPEKIGKLILGDGGYLGKLISSDLDVDRMDFLVRDAHHTGVAYGVIDLDRLINTLERRGDSIVVNEGGLRAVESLLVARFLMTPTVYLHHTSRIADAMFLRAVERAIGDGALDKERLYRMDDLDVLTLLRNSGGYAGDIGRRLDERRLFKRAYSMDYTGIKPALRKRLLGLREDAARLRAIEDEFAANCKLDEGYVIFDIPPLQHKELEISIVKDGDAFGIGELSPLAGILTEAHKRQWNVGIYAPRERLERVAKECNKLESYLI